MSTFKLTKISHIPAPAYSIRRSCASWLLFAIALIAGCLCTSCSQQPDPLQVLIQQAAQSEQMRNEQTFNEMADIIKASPKKYEQFITTDGALDIDAISEAVSQAAERQGAKVSWDLHAYGASLSAPLRLRIMLERSGSMNGYDARTGNGDFKRVLSELITRFPAADSTQSELLIVNDDIYPYPGTMQTFVQDKNVFESTALIGNPAFTDFAKIFNASLTDSIPERVTVLVTDMIYSPADTHTTGAEKIFNEEGALAANLFKTHPDKSMLIVKLEADFQGAYYPYGSSSPFDYKGKRPYYLIITGSAAALSRLRGDENYASFFDFKSLPGYQQQYFFNRQSLPLQWWSIMPRKSAAEGEFTLAGGSAATGSHALRNPKAGRGGKLQLTLAVDFSGIPAQPQYLLDKANYQLKSDAPAELIDIQEVTPEMTDPRTKRYLNKATHLITLQVNARTMPEQLTLNLLGRLPAWINESNALTDHNPYAATFPSTTFGLQPFLQGVYEAYYGTAQIPSLTSLNIRFEK